MGTGISRVGVALAVLTLGLAGCGGSTGRGSTSGGSTSGATTTPAGSTTGASRSATAPGRTFGWLRPAAAPAGWTVVRIPTGAAMAYPPGWGRQHSDAGTATAVLRTAGGSYLGYVNLTPRQGAETLEDWSSFRIEHNAEEGDRHVRRLAAATNLHFLTGHGSCVKDAYSTQIGSQFVEIACLVAGPRAESVIVAAAPPAAWNRESATLERAVEAVRP
jgi:hypothetical protein